MTNETSSKNLSNDSSLHPENVVLGRHLPQIETIINNIKPSLSQNQSCETFQLCPS